MPPQRAFANGILPGNGAEGDPRQPEQCRRAVQHAIGFAPGAIEEDEVGSHGAPTSQEMLPCLYQGQGLLIRPQQVALDSRVGKQGIEPFVVGKILPT